LVSPASLAKTWKSERIIIKIMMHKLARKIVTYTHTHPFNGPLSGTTWVSRYQKDTINLDFAEARDSGWQWHQLGHMQACTSLQTDNHTSTPLLGFLQAGCPSCRPTNSAKALKAREIVNDDKNYFLDDNGKVWMNLACTGLKYF